MVKKGFNILVVLLLSFVPLFGQDVPSVSATVDSSKINLAGQTILHLKATIGKGDSIVFPIYDEEINQNIEIIEILNEDVIAKGDVSYQNKDYLITSFNPGVHAIEPQNFFYFKNKKGPADTLETEAFIIKVDSVAVNLNDKFNGIKKPMDVKIPSYLWIYILGGILFTGFLIVLAWWLVKKRKEKLLAPKPVDPLAWYYDILNAVKGLETEATWEYGNYKLYYSSLTHQLKLFCYRRFGINGLESTSDQFLDMIKTSRNRGVLEKYRIDNLLYRADMTKYAKMKPLDVDCKSDLENIKRLITDFNPEHIKSEWEDDGMV